MARFLPVGVSVSAALVAVLAIFSGTTRVWSAPVSGVVLDGSFGAKGALAGPGFIIPASDGRQVGGNLFQSFSQFNLTSAQSATFTATGSSGPIGNILARVTGGPSSIDGAINSDISGANLFLLNPSGVMFGAHAQVNVKGAFVVGTPDYAKLGGTGKFNTSLGKNDNLTSAPVSAFGFLSSAPAAILLNGTKLKTKTTGTGLDLVGGNVTLSNASLNAPSGKISIFSAGNAGTVPFSLASPGSGFASATNTKFGTLRLQDKSTVAIDGKGGGGQIVAQGGDVVINNGAKFTADNRGKNLGGGIKVVADSLSLLEGGEIVANTLGGNAGHIQLDVREMTINGAGSQVLADSSIGATGSGGTITVCADQELTLENGGLIKADTRSAGRGGNIAIEAPAVLVDGDKDLSRQTAIVSNTFGAGSGGNVDLTKIGALTLQGGGYISSNASSTFVTGFGGNVDLTKIGTLTLRSGGFISSNTYGQGKAGTVKITARDAVVEDANTSISSNCGYTSLGKDVVATGAGGSVIMDLTGSLQVLNKGAISAKTGSVGNGGNVTIQAQSVTVGGGGVIASSSQNGMDMQGNMVYATGNGGTVTLNVGDELLLQNGAGIDVSAEKIGGDIFLNVGQLVYLVDSQITAEAGEQGGNITIDPQFVILYGSAINAKAPHGQGGNIAVTSSYLFDSASIESSIVATGKTNGTVMISAPDLNLAGSLLVLPSDLVKAEKQLRERCERSMNHEFSSLSVVGRGGVETAPGELQSDFGEGLPGK